MSKAKCSICGAISEYYTYSKKLNKVSCHDCLGIDHPKPKQCAVCNQWIIWRYNHELGFTKYNPGYVNYNEGYHKGAVTAHICKTKIDFN